jgi:integrase/recombinase XerC
MGEVEAARLLLTRMGLSPEDLLASPGDRPTVPMFNEYIPATRQAVPDTRLAEINQVAATTGNDPALDSLLLRLHVETACRRGGALALRPQHLDQDQCLVLMREKGETMRWQPVSPTLMAHLLQHADTHSTEPTAQLLRYTNGRPITRRRYDYLWTRIGKHLPWVAVQQISTHWPRHTTLTWVQRNFGLAIASTYAVHTSQTSAQVTATCVRATLQGVAAALAALTRQPHPLTCGDDLEAGIPSCRPGHTGRILN